MNVTSADSPQQPQAVRWHDPVLDELWSIKRGINRDAGYDLQRLHEQARLAARSWLSKVSAAPSPTVKVAGPAG